MSNEDIIKSVLEDLGIIIHSTNAYGFRCLCPFHKERDPSFSVSNTTGWWRCFASCGSGSIHSLLRRFGLDTDINLPRIQRPNNLREKDRPTEGEILYYRRTLSPNLIRRGFDIETLDRFEIGYDQTGRKQPETIFPVRSEDQELLAYLHSPRSGKYYYEGAARERAFFGANHLNQLGPEDEVILCEGPTDVMKIWQISGRTAIASMSADLAYGQIQWIENSRQPLVVLLDNDAAGFRGSLRLWGRLRGRRSSLLYIDWANFERKTEVFLKDPGELETLEDLELLLSCRTRLLPQSGD